MNTVFTRKWYRSVAGAGLAASLCFPQLTYAQRPLKYNEVFETVRTAPKEQSFYTLLEFQRLDPKHSNTYLHMALFSLEWAKNTDPLVNYNVAKHHIYHTELYLGLCKLYLDAKDVRRNQEYFTMVAPVSAEKKIEHEQVISFIDQKVKEIKEYDQNITAIYMAYDGAVRNYNLSVDLFKQIIDRNSNAKDLYLTADGQLLEQVARLQQSFDSTLIHFENYQKGLNTYPVKSYKHKLELKNIETFRLEGLTDANFLMPHIQVWNFGKWIKDLNTVLKNDISSLRADIEKTDAAQRALKAKLESSAGIYTESYEPYVLPNVLQNKISKYDYQSLVLALFRYNEAKINFLKKAQLSYNNPATAEQLPLLRKARYYEELTEAKKQLDQLQKDLLARINAANVKKHERLIADKYQGELGLKTYAEEEAGKNASLFNQAIDNLKNEIRKEEDKLYLVAETASWKTDLIPLKLNSDALSAEEGYKVKARKMNVDGTYYLAGAHTSAQGTVAFVAMASPDHKITWLKTINNEAGPDVAMALEPSATGCFAVVSTVSATDPKQISNQLITFDKTGKELSKASLAGKGLARSISYDELNDKLITAYHGVNEKWYDAEHGNTEFVLSNAKGETKWNTSIQMRGELLDIIRMDNELIVFANYASVNTGSSKQDIKQSGSGLSTNLFSVVLSAEGKVNRTTLYPLQGSFYGLKALKLNSNQISVIGLTGEARTSPAATQAGNSYYLLTDAQGNPQFVKE